ncbi:hypothetical protein D0Z08_30675 [Nocardioides immobilis]|uniref:Uncharacterized protein n=1 Tax=Nocardioides immobilis TaxID=2049295 RepID=A0A417XS12_9ACTN|nr:hypothetical protein D0Z08_30675 [Nocardioides immobilis]
MCGRVGCAITRDQELSATDPRTCRTGRARQGLGRAACAGLEHDGLEAGGAARCLRAVSFAVPEHLYPVFPAYEERFLFFVLTALRQTSGRIVYVTSQPILPRLIDYFLSMIRGWIWMTSVRVSRLSPYPTGHLVR